MAAFLVLAVCSPGILPVASGATPSGSFTAPPDLTLRQIHMIETRAGSKLWEVWAERAELNEREGYTVLSRVSRPVEVVLYSDQGQLRCRANRVTLDLKTKDVRMEGAVQARSEEGTELKTEVLRWIAASRRLQTDQPVTLSRGGLVSRGRGLEAETDLERVRIFQNITSHLQKPSANPVAGRSRPR